MLTNAALWAIAIAVHPVATLVPTSSGEPPKIFSLLIPMFLLVLAGLSTRLVGAGAGAES